MADANVIGGVQVVDSLTGDHRHLPVGQGNMPVVEAIKYLKKKGYSGNITSEGHGESQLGANRQLTKAWEAMGNRISKGGYSGGGFGGGGGFGASSGQWGDVYQSYFGANQPPYFVFGSYSPSNDWSLWSQVPME